MSDKNNNAMMNNNMNNDNDPKERMRKKVKKAAGIVQYLPVVLQQAPLKESIQLPDGTAVQ